MTEAVRPRVLRPGVRTYKPRRSRITANAAAALAARADLLLPLSDERIDLPAAFAGRPVVMEIGFGDGSATAAMAAADPSTGILAVDVHTPGVGALLHRIDRSGLTNVRVIEADAVAVLTDMVGPGDLVGLRAYFPDPWPKARHHKRRLVQPAIRDLVRDRIATGGWWHLATDWEPYAAAMVECFGEDARWVGGIVPRPSDRPTTRFERRALREGRTVTDLLYRYR